MSIAHYHCPLKIVRIEILWKLFRISNVDRQLDETK